MPIKSAINPLVKATVTDSEIPWGTIHKGLHPKLFDFFKTQVMINFNSMGHKVTRKG
jgi:hypothetical protein